MVDYVQVATVNWLFVIDSGRKSLDLHTHFSCLNIIQPKAVALRPWSLFN